MKKFVLYSLLFAFTFSLQSCIVSRHPNMGFFDNPYYNYNDAQFMSINVPMFLAKPFIKKALKEDGESEELINLVKKIGDVKLMMVSNGNEKMVSDFSKYLIKSNFEEWMTIKKENEVIKIQAKQKGNQIRNILITIASGKNLIYVDVTGKFMAEDISRIANFSEKNDLRKLAIK
ncbi:MAG: DUF4252 domain-containing protein [Flavobacteriales bacterium]|nr:DUF4252 domain-containing protein [Flavobacteriales bacterium]MCA0392276.1 DUF4252 domain-containing protein [Bacteroidota bacterium]